MKSTHCLLYKEAAVKALTTFLLLQPFQAQETQSSLTTITLRQIINSTITLRQIINLTTILRQIINSTAMYQQIPLIMRLLEQHSIGKIRLHKCLVRIITTHTLTAIIPILSMDQQASAMPIIILLLNLQVKASLDHQLISAHLTYLLRIMINVSLGIVMPLKVSLEIIIPPIQGMPNIILSKVQNSLLL